MLTTKIDDTMVCMVRYNDYLWKVEAGTNTHKYFPSVEAAADFAVDSCNVLDEHVDVALCHMYANNHMRAIFSSLGEFLSTEAV